MAICFRRLATGDSFESVSLQFGFGVSSCHRICSEGAILTDETSDFITFSANEPTSKAKNQGFQEEYGIPQIIGAIEGCHFEIYASHENKEDTSFKFLDISMGYTGCLYDSRVLTLSPIYDAILKEEVMAAPKTEIGGHTIGSMLAGDSTYPLNRHIIIPFSKRCRISRAGKNFNRNFCAVRSVIERALTESFLL